MLPPSRRSLPRRPEGDAAWYRLARACVPVELKDLARIKWQRIKLCFKGVFSGVLSYNNADAVARGGARDDCPRRSTFGLIGVAHGCADFGLLAFRWTLIGLAVST